MRKPKKISIFQLNKRKYLNIDMDGGFITVDLTKIKEDLDKKLIELGFATQEELDKEWGKSRL